MAFPDGYVVFEAEYNYQTNHKEEISLRVGDKCIVKKPVDPQGWLYGKNMRTNHIGQFPGTYCRMLQPQTQDQALPPLPPKPQRMVINLHLSL